MILGAVDEIVPAELGKSYQTAARKKGDRVRLTVVAGAGHFDLIAPAVLCLARGGRSNTIVVEVEGTLIFVNRSFASKVG